MNSWQELNDFSAWEKKIPCILCKKESEKTLVGEHWKCGTCDHLFNNDNSSLPEGVICYCEICNPRKKNLEGLAERVAGNVASLPGAGKVPIHREVKKGRWAVVDKVSGKIIRTYDLPKLPDGKFMEPHKPYDVKVLKKVLSGDDNDLEKGSIAQVSCKGKSIDLGLFKGNSGMVYKGNVKEGKDFEFVGFPKSKKKKG